VVAEDDIGFNLNREELLRNVRLQARRNRYCWSLPVAYIGYLLFVVDICLHVQVEMGFQVQTDIKAQFGCTEGAGIGVTSADALYSYLLDTYVPLVYSQTTLGTQAGGWRLSQSRAAAAPCSMQDVAMAMIPGATLDTSDCYSLTQSSTESYLPPTLINSSAAPAFSPYTQPAGTSQLRDNPFDPFQLVFDNPMWVDNTTKSQDAAVGALNDLWDNSWIDAATRVVHVELAVVQLSTNTWARILVSTYFQPGGLVESFCSVGSVQAEPYAGPMPPSPGRGIIVLDIILIVYLVFIFWQLATTAWHKIRRVRRRWKMQRVEVSEPNH
jgi:hypothetical protein